MLHIIITKYKILVTIDNDMLALPEVEQVKSITHLLIPISKTDKYIISSLNSDLPLDSHSSLQLIGLRQALNHFDDELLKTIIYYQQLEAYYNTHQFCGSCGNRTTRQEKNKFVHCPKCQHEIYPHIAPCIIVRIHKNDEILMARGIGFAPNVWGLIAGFVEVGETLEQAVIREVKEEVGIEIEDINYWGSQPWPFPSNSLMVGYTAKYKSGNIIIDPNEIEQAGFFSKDMCPGRPSTSYSIASKMIDEFLSK